MEFTMEHPFYLEVQKLQIDLAGKDLPCSRTEPLIPSAVPLQQVALPALG